MNLKEALVENFGYEEFRPNQEPIIRKTMEGRDILGVLPTGAGKSLCYQLPALLLPQPTLVLSPLIALMKDQLDSLPPAVYPKATLINSSLEADELDRRLAAIHAGEYKLIYAAPERLRQQGFLRLLRSIRLSLVVVDEAHCVSVWGHDFRPDYLFIRKALVLLSEDGDPPPVLALTATATPEMQVEISEQLGRKFEILAASPFRSNLRLEVYRCANADEKMRRLVEICKDTPGAGIVYASSRESCEKLAAFLRSHGLSAAHYHAGLSREERQTTQERFMIGRIPLIVATVAFGMGVDKSNVRLVAHFNLPHSLEAYSQESGRAGRDGRVSRCVLLYAPADKSNLKRWMKQEEIGLETVRDVYRALRNRLGRETGSISPEEITQEVFGDPSEKFGADTTLRVAISLLERIGLVTRHPDAGRDMRVEMLPAPRSSRADLEALLESRSRHAEKRLETMVAYAEGTECRHVMLSRHFGVKMKPCGGSCDRCLGTVAEPLDSRPAPPNADQIADIGRAILLTIQNLPFPMGRTGVVKVLSGAADSPVRKDRCENYGILAGFTRSALMKCLDNFIETGWLESNPDDEYRRLFVTDQGRIALEEERMILANPHASAPARSAGGSSPRAAAPKIELTDDEEDRFERLRSWRRIEADRAKVPPYVIFHDATLRELARSFPRTLREMEMVSGVGPSKIERYGAATLALLKGEEPPALESD